MVLAVGLVEARALKTGKMKAALQAKKEAVAEKSWDTVDPAFTVTTEATDEDGTVNYLYTCFSEDGTYTSPPVEWSGAPEETVSYALALYQSEENSVASYHIFWFMYNIDPSITSLVANCSQIDSSIGTVGVNNANTNDYFALCAGGGGLRYYYLTIYAMDSKVFVDVDPKTASIYLFDSLYADNVLESATVEMHYDKDVDGPSA